MVLTLFATKNMRIGIDCRLWNESGVGRYIRNLVHTLDLLDKKNEYVLFFLSKDLENAKVPVRFKKVSVDVPWHTLREQIVMPGIFMKENLDVLHVPYINVPLFYPRKLVITIHDLIPLKFPNPKASKLPLPLYLIKLFFYYIILFIGIRKSFKILTVSKTAKEDILKTFKIRSNKVAVTYNFNLNLKIHSISKDKENYLLYVGNAFPHKNLHRLIRAYEIFVSRLAGRGAKTPKLILVGKMDYFYEKLRDIIPLEMKAKIVFMGFCEEEKLEKLYRNSLAVIQPSLYEGFGYQLLEASFLGTMVVCSNIPVFKELASDTVLYFDPKDEEDMASKLILVSTMSLEDRLDYIERSRVALSRFDPKQEIEKVLEVYTSYKI